MRSVSAYVTRISGVVPVARAGEWPIGSAISNHYLASPCNVRDEDGDGGSDVEFGFLLRKQNIAIVCGNGADAIRILRTRAARRQCPIGVIQAAADECDLL